MKSWPIVLTLCLAAAALAQNADPYKAALKYEYGKSRADLSAIEEEVRKSSPEQYRAIEPKLIAMIKDDQATVEARQFACRMLQVVGSAQCVPVIAPLLKDEKTSHMARFALESIQDPAAGAALRDGLSQVQGKLLAGMIGSVAARRDAQAVPTLANLTGESDPVIAGAALTALGQIGTPDAAKAIAAAKVADALKSVQSRALIEAAQSLAQSGNKADALAIFKPLVDAKQPSFIRTAAFRGVVESQEPAAAAKLIAGAVAGEDAPLRIAALSLLLPTADVSLRTAIAEQVPTLPAEAQALLLPLLADQKDITLRPALLSILQSSKDDVARAAAMDAMTWHGTPQDVPMLAKLAAEAENSPARKVLKNMTAKGTDEAAGALLQDADAKVRLVAVAVLADRHSPAGLPAIVKALSDSDAAVVNEALKALNNVGTAGQVPGLVDIVASTSDAARRDAAAGAIKAIVARTTDKSDCAKPVQSALSSAKSAAVSAALLQVLPKIGDASSLAAVTQSVSSSDADVREAAIRALADWPTMDAGAPLIQVAKSSTNETHAILALRGCVRLARNVKDQPAPARIALLNSVLQSAKRTDEKKQAISALAEVTAPESLAALRPFLKDAALQSDAAMAITRLSRDLGSLGGKAAISALEEIKTLPVSADIKKQLDGAITAVKSTGMNDGFIISWLLAGPYTKADKDGAGLFDVKFAPEDDGAATWRPISANANRIVDLQKAIGGDNRVAYLKTILTSEIEQDARMEVGSDDGVKVFVNGQKVFGANATRPVTPGQDKFNIKLKKGANTILLKVTQGGGDWGAVARLRSADGKDPSKVYIGLGQE